MKSSTRLGLLAATLGLAVLGTVGACSATADPSKFTSSTGGSGSNAGPTTGTGGAGGGDIGLGGNNTGGSQSSGGGVDPVTCDQAAANKTYIGCDFWPTVTDNIVFQTFDFAVAVANTGDVPADVTVERNGVKVGSVQVAANGLGTVYLPWVPELRSAVSPLGACVPMSPLTNTVAAKGGAYHLVSSRPVTVYQFNAIEYQGIGGPPGKDWSQCPGSACGLIYPGCFSFTNDASLLLPSTAMTGNYRVTGQTGWVQPPDPNDPNPMPKPFAGPFVVVTGTADGTSVTMSLASTAKIMGGGGVPSTKGGGSVTFMVNAGDVVEVIGAADSDFSGSLVKATKPVQVITGIACTQSPIGVIACDHMEESAFPAETLGKHYFVTVPTSPHGDVVGHVVRLYGNADNTLLSYASGKPAGAPSTLQAGQVVDLGIVHADFEISGDHEFAVGSFQLGAELVDPNTFAPKQQGDPAQSLSTAVEQYRKKYVFLAPADYEVSFVDVVQQMNTTLMLDGNMVGIKPTAIGSGYGVARILLGGGKGGAHLIVGSAPIGIQVMGYGAYTSYQYPGGLNLDAIAPPPPK
ncbi:MAG: IgGFc-binding protein [Byssovorax sp.]